MKTKIRKLQRKFHTWKNGKVPYVKVGLTPKEVPVEVYWPEGHDYEKFAYMLSFMLEHTPSLADNVRLAVIQYATRWGEDEAGAFIINIMDGLSYEESLELAREGLCSVNPPERPKAEPAPPEQRTTPVTFIPPSQFLNYHRNLGNLSMQTRGED